MKLRDSLRRSDGAGGCELSKLELIEEISDRIGKVTLTKVALEERKLAESALFSRGLFNSLKNVMGPKVNLGSTTSTYKHDTALLACHRRQRKTADETASLVVSPIDAKAACPLGDAHMTSESIPICTGEGVTQKQGAVPGLI